MISRGVFTDTIPVKVLNVGGVRTVIHVYYTFHLQHVFTHILDLLTHPTLGFQPHAKLAILGLGLSAPPVDTTYTYRKKMTLGCGNSKRL